MAEEHRRQNRRRYYMTAYLSLGSNVGDRAANLREAIARLAPAVRVLRVSPVYETAPVDYTDQDWFLNLVVEAVTDLPAAGLLAHTAGIESALGRVRTTPKGPRTIDIDILLYGDEVVNTAELEIPHPRMAARRFVLAPLADLAPELRHPITRRTVLEMLEAAPAQDLRRV
jgi:2-amino-4-hydroxy-6-hydroxymethyldihydropteridine diphosphokinase